MSNPLDSVLNLIAATILADKRVYASEVDVFIKQSSRLKLIRRLDPKISEAKLLSWYELNKDSINDRLSTPYFKDWFYATLDQIAELPDKQSVRILRPCWSK